MKKIIILLLCCGGLVSMMGCGGNTAPPTESPPTTVLEAIITETPTKITPLITAVEPTEKEKELASTESKAQTAEPTSTAPTATTNPKTEIKPTITNTAEEKTSAQVVDAFPNTTPQLTESETPVAEPPKEGVKVDTIQETVSVQEIKKPKFDINYWIVFAKKYAISIGLILDSEAIECWDNPIRAGAHCIHLERDIRNRLNRYAKDEDITDVWIWAEATGNDCYDLYIGYA